MDSGLPSTAGYWTDGLQHGNLRRLLISGCVCVSVGVVVWWHVCECKKSLMYCGR